MVAFKHIFLFLATTSAWIIARDVNTILNNLKVIDTATKKWTTDSKAWDGTAGGSITVQNDILDIDKKIRGAIDEIFTSEAVITSAEQQKLAAYVASPLKPDVITAINSFVGRKSAITKAGLLSLAKNDLVTLRDDFRDLCGAMFGVTVSPPFGTKPPCDQIYTAFNSGISVLS